MGKGLYKKMQQLVFPTFFKNMTKRDNLGDTNELDLTLHEVGNLILEHCTVGQ